MPQCPVCNDIAGDCGEGLSRCLMCDHVFQWPPEVSCVYDKAYIATRYDVYDTTPSMNHLRLGFVQAFADGGKLLDVGYGNGSFLKLAEKNGFDIYGKDVHGADYGIRESELNAREWDVVTFFDSLEHFPDLAPVREMKSRLVIVSIPARPVSFPSDRSWKHYRPGEHLHYFTVDSLKLFFEDRMQLVRVSNLEDVVRGKRGEEPNIVTCVFVSKVCV